jgi:hypothetical protein
MASGHLIPEESQFSGMFMPEYYGMVIEALEGAYDDDVKVRALIFPSFFVEHAVGIRLREDKYFIFTLTPDKQYWGYMALESYKDESTLVLKNGEFQRDEESIRRLESQLPKDFHDIEVKRCEVEIPKEVAESAIDAWEQMLRRTRYPAASSTGLDGVTIHFSMDTKFQRLAGKIWSPKPESQTGQLVQISRHMYRMCEDSENSINELQSKINALLIQLSDPISSAMKARKPNKSFKGQQPQAAAADAINGAA